MTFSILVYTTDSWFILIPNRLVCHFDLKKFRLNEVKRVKISLACVFAFMAIGWPLIIYKTGIMGWIKFWLMPWLGYHFWVISLLSWKLIFFNCHWIFLFPYFCLDGCGDVLAKLKTKPITRRCIKPLICVFH